MTFSNDVQQRLVDRIAQVPDAERVDWGRIGEFASDLGAGVSRTTLNKSELVVRAFQDHRERHRRWRADPERAGAERGVDPVKVLKAIIAALKARIEAAERRLLRYVSNAELNGLTIEQLEAPIAGVECDAPTRNQAPARRSPDKGGRRAGRTSTARPGTSGWSAEPGTAHLARAGEGPEREGRSPPEARQVPGPESDDAPIERSEAAIAGLEGDATTRDQGSTPRRPGEGTTRAGRPTTSRNRAAGASARSKASRTPRNGGRPGRGRRRRPDARRA